MWTRTLLGCTRSNLHMDHVGAARMCMYHNIFQLKYTYYTSIIFIDRKFYCL